MKKIVMFDTSYSTQNVGDFIINEAINNQMKDLLLNNFVVRFPTHTPLLKFTQNFKKNIISDFCQSSDYKFLCGTNIFKYNLAHLTPDFNINLFDLKNYKGVISLGCGVTKSRKKPNLYTKYIYKKILSKKYIHSTRDENTKEFLNSLGFEAINTGCPTMWSLNKEHCEKIPTKKSNSVIFTLTDYKKDKQRDQILIDILNKNYEKVYFWIQGSEDLEYFKTLNNIDNIIQIMPNLESYKKCLTSGNIDYVGTRLHAGIYAMQNYVRSIIIIVDNRARDIKEHYNIVAIERNDIKEKLEKLINDDFKTDININESNINKWKSQFINGANNE